MMGSGTLDDRYLEWLYSQVADVKARQSSCTYWKLFRQLYSTEFTWFVPNDDNRAADGRELRREWASETGVNPDRQWMSLGCSFLELLIGLAHRLTFEAEKDAEFWFWHLLGNLELLGCSDRDRYSVEYVDSVVRTVIDRTYDRNGRGGLFPLRKATKDQRKVEIWYQLCEYLLQDQ